MARSFILLILVFIKSFSPPPSYPTGKVMESIELDSKVLGKKIKYSVYLPPNYEKNDLHYPVLYLLHGFGDSEIGWTQWGEVKTYIDKGVHNGEVKPMIIIMPDGGKSWYINDMFGELCYEDFFETEFIPAIEAKYRIKKEKNNRAIAGLSMGGYGALIHSLKHPNYYIACAGISAAVRSDQDMIELSQKAWDFRSFPTVFGTKPDSIPLLTSHWYDNSVLSFAEKSDIKKLKTVKYWLDCGDDDYLLTGNTELSLILKKRKVPHEFRVRDGEHDWTYWKTGIYDILKFVSGQFIEKQPEKSMKKAKR